MKNLKNISISKLKSPVTVSVVNDHADIVLPLSVMFLGLVLSLTIIFLVIS